MVVYLFRTGTQCGKFSEDDKNRIERECDVEAQVDFRCDCRLGDRLKKGDGYAR